MTGTASSGEVADLYDALGPLLNMVWDDNFHFGYWEGPDDVSTVAQATDRFTDVLVERLGVGPGRLVLDVGCGVGKPARRLATTTGADVLGISVNSQQVETATRRARAAGLAERVRFAEADAMAMPFPDASFDAVLALESVIHMDRGVALREMRRVLVPGGKLVLTDLTRPADSPAPDWSTKLTSLVRLADYHPLAAEAGLVVDELVDVSEQTKPTMSHLVRNIRRHRDEFESQHGVSIAAMIEATSSPLVDNSDIGCLILVAHRPL